MIEHRNLRLENFWKKDVSEISDAVLQLWKVNGGPVGQAGLDRLNQIVIAVRKEDGSVGGLSTASKVYVKQLRNYFFTIRLMLSPDCRIPGLTSRLLVATRDHLESIPRDGEINPAIGIITLVENSRIKQYRTEAIWPASGMVYIGNSPAGHPIRVYYFKGARILP